MGLAEVDGLQVAYRREGEGPPVLLLHGAMSDSREWRHQLAALSQQFTVIAWDAPGSGGSDDPPEHWRLPDFAHCVAGLCAALDVARPHLVGLSFGGGLALEVYRQHPGLPRSLSLLSAYAGWRGSLPPHEVAARLAACLEPPVDPTPADVLVYLGDDPPTEVVAELVALGTGVRAVTSRVTGRAFAEADLRDVLPQVEVPVLVLHGEADRRCPLSVGEALHAAIPGSQLVVLPGVGHCSNLEAPALVTEELRRFFSGTGAGAVPR